MTLRTQLGMIVGAGITACVAGICLAAPLASNPGTPFEKLEQEYQSLNSTVQQVNGQIGDIVQIVEPYGLDIQAKVDTEVCATGATQCAYGTLAPASSNNANPIRMFVFVKSPRKAPVGVLNLTSDLFLFDNPFTPGGAPEAVKCDTNCTDAWFAEGGNGLYSIFLRPAPTDPQMNWKAGMYAATIYVYDGEAGVGRILVTWVIPAAPNVNQ